MNVSASKPTDAVSVVRLVKQRLSQRPFPLRFHLRCPGFFGGEAETISKAQTTFLTSDGDGIHDAAIVSVVDRMDSAAIYTRAGICPVRFERRALSVATSANQRYGRALQWAHQCVGWTNTICPSCRARKHAHPIPCHLQPQYSSARPEPSNADPSPQGLAQN